MIGFASKNPDGIVDPSKNAGILCMETTKDQGKSHVTRRDSDDNGRHVNKSNAYKRHRAIPDEGEIVEDNGLEATNGGSTKQQQYVGRMEDSTMQQEVVDMKCK